MHELQKSLYQLLQSRELFAYRFFRNAEGRPWRLREYQRASLESHALRKVHCDGRDVGKTTEIEIIACWAMVCMPGTSMLIATQCENHLFPVMNRLVRRFETSPEFSGNIAELRRSPSYFIRFNNGFILWGRIAGPRGINFQGMHVDWQIVDEAQEMTDTSWGELYQALNAGGRRWVYGVPNGLRNTFYRMTFLAEAEQYHWPSYLNPEFTKQKDEELAYLYGGRDSPGYIHRVLGLHGEPVNAVFNLDDYLSCVDESLPLNEVILKNSVLELELPSDIPAGHYYLGCDLGFAQAPSEFVVYRNEPPYLIGVFRVHLEHVNYAQQQEVIQALDRAYHFRRIGIDCGNSGRAVAHLLMSLGYEWERKICAFEFGAMIETGHLSDGTVQRRRTKEWMTELLQRRLTEHTIIFPKSVEREQQYANHTYLLNAQGQYIYSKGNDHIIDADRCAILAWYLDTYNRGIYPSKLRAKVFTF
ncbi:MAG TPA: hypothetical protein PLT82_11150 [Candidatus Hydrogenedens sp.]|nr:hypothetical protein [Candidatus Hydrogenedens sp.]HOL20967.1 hypothetical protein [Candidatus Hydrogenedens sp.]HPP59679.1 hypothetical protein [Candidatus Hydrogenedens sp.]